MVQALNEKLNLTVFSYLSSQIKTGELTCLKRSSFIRDILPPAFTKVCQSVHPVHHMCVTQRHKQFIHSSRLQHASSGP